MVGRVCVPSLLMTSISLVKQKAKLSAECEEGRGGIRRFEKNESKYSIKWKRTFQIEEPVCVSELFEQLCVV